MGSSYMRDRLIRDHTNVPPAPWPETGETAAEYQPPYDPSYYAAEEESFFRRHSRKFMVGVGFMALLAAAVAGGEAKTYWLASDGQLVTPRYGFAPLEAPLKGAYNHMWYHHVPTGEALIGKDSTILEISANEVGLRDPTAESDRSIPPIFKQRLRKCADDVQQAFAGMRFAPSVLNDLASEKMRIIRVRLTLDDKHECNFVFKKSKTSEETAFPAYNQNGQVILTGILPLLYSSGTLADVQPRAS